MGVDIPDMVWVKSPLKKTVFRALFAYENATGASFPLTAVPSIFIGSRTGKDDLLTQLQDTNDASRTNIYRTRSPSFVSR
jgi:hypothetical protein